MHPTTSDDQQLDQQIAALLHTLYAEHSEITTEQLLDYALGIATPTEARRLEVTLPTNGHLREELRQLQQLNNGAANDGTAGQQTTTTPSTQDRLQSWLRAQWPHRQLTQALAPLTTAPTPAVRGNTDGYRVYNADHYRLAFTIATEKTANTSMLQGQLIDIDDPATACHGQIQLLTSHANEPPAIVAESALDSFGYFSLAVTAPGTYLLVAALPTHTIWIQDLQLP